MFGGLVGALVFFVLSMTPTLLPRGSVCQALIGGLAAATGYGIGVAPPGVSALVGVVVVVFLTVGLINGVIVNPAMSSLSSGFGVVDHGTREGVVQPTSSQRSGGSGSLAGWGSLGRQGASN